MKPKVSVIIPVYNAERYLKECLDSVIAQSLQEIEVICVDDGSQDSSGEILDEYARADTRVRVIHKVNEGYGKAVNVGLDGADGEYVAIVEPDDFILPDMYETLYREARSCDAEIVKADYFDLSTYNTKNRLKVRQLSTDFTLYYRNVSPNQELNVYVLSTFHSWTGIYSLPFLRKHHIRYNETSGTSFQDIGFFFQVYSNCKRLRLVPHPFYCNRVDISATSMCTTSRINEFIGEFVFIKSKLQENQMIGLLSTVYSYWKFEFYHNLFKQLKPEYEIGFARRFKAEMLKFVIKHEFDTGFLSEDKRFALSILLFNDVTYVYLYGKSCPTISIKLKIEILKRFVSVYGRKKLIQTYVNKLLSKAQ